MAERTATSASHAATQAILRWPQDRPLAALVSGPGVGAWSRRSLLAEPREVRLVRVPSGLGAAEARRAVERELRGALTRSGASGAGWIVAFAYDVGRVFEPKGQAIDGARDDRDWPLAILLRCPDALLLDHASDTWSVVGNAANLPLTPEDLAVDEDIEPAPCSVGPLERETDRPGFERAVAECIQRIRDGELFQANLARRESGAFSGSTRALAARALEASGAWFGAYLECDPGRALVSMSPELFLDVSAATRRAVTRPIKGTLPARADPQALRRSEKDGAELTMIVDLMRNDLGRVCEIGSVKVDAARIIETHPALDPAVHHGVAEVSGTLRAGVDAVDLLAATFPPGSVTGAPKVQAMRVIDELEPVRRGPYCGAIGLVRPDGSLTLNVAIRTMSFVGRGDARRPGVLDGTLDYWAGCGIVADSMPSSEWEESVAKCEVLMRAIKARGQGSGARGQ